MKRLAVVAPLLPLLAAALLAGCPDDPSSGGCQPDSCEAPATCQEVDGRAACICPAGWENPDQGRACRDVDECQSAAACDPHARCVNSPGSHACECLAGYTGDGARCALNTPDPAAVAPVLDRTVPTLIGPATEFLYTGDGAIQRGVAPGTIDPARVAVLRGRVLDREGKPLPDVEIDVLNHPEFGHTLSRVDGVFDLAANGGGRLTLRYRKAGFLAGQRTLEVPWQDFSWAPDLTLVPVDPAANAVDGRGAAEVQVARGSPVSDADGSRQATLLIPAQTTASMRLPDGTSKPLGAMTVRATEFTVGKSGPSSMPADLPQETAYTYAVEYSVDEADAAGAASVEFSKPIPTYLENFLKLPVGVRVPAGYYDRVQAAWRASDDGRVIAVLGQAGGKAELDCDGDGAADGAESLAALGIDDAERAKLAALYPNPQSLWRVAVKHFTPWDYNFPKGPPKNARPPKRFSPNRKRPQPAAPSCRAGSIIACESQALGEEIEVPGAPFALRYDSARVEGRRDNYTLRIPLTDGPLPEGLVSVDVRVEIAGQKHTASYPSPAPGQEHVFEWDGMDAYGRKLSGRQPVQVSVGFTYGLVYYASREDWGQSWGRAMVLVSSGGGGGGGSSVMVGPGFVSASKSDASVTLWSVWKGSLGSWDPVNSGIGGFTVTAHHVYDPLRQELWMGTGEKREAGASGMSVVETVAGNGVAGFSGDGGPANKASLNFPLQSALAPDGTLYLCDAKNHRVRKIDRAGKISTVAGTGQPGSTGDGGPATDAQLNLPAGLAIGPDGSLFVSELEGKRIRRITPDGKISTFAGKGCGGLSGDGGPATEACIDRPGGLDVGPDGTLYLTDGPSFGASHSNHMIRRVTPDGIIQAVAGKGSRGFSGDGGPATEAQLAYPSSVRLGPDGSLYIGDELNHRVRKVTPDGIIHTIAGTGEWGFSGDGGPAIQARLNRPVGAYPIADGSVFVGDSSNHRLRRIDPDGTISTVAGSGPVSDNPTTAENGAYTGDGEAAAAARFNCFIGGFVGADGWAYLGDEHNQRLRRMRLPPLGFRLGDLYVPSAGGAELYVFDSTGRHLRTVDALTGVTILGFEYDKAGRLSAVLDRDRRAARIERDADGRPTAIVGRDGERTTLQLGASGYLESISGGATSMRFGYGEGGLMTRLVDARGGEHTFKYSGEGRLIEDRGPTGIVRTLTRVDLDDGYRVEVANSLGEATRYEVHSLPDGGRRQRVTDPSGLAWERVDGIDGKIKQTFADGSTRVEELGPDPRFGMATPYARVTEVTSAALTGKTTKARAATFTDPASPLELLTWEEVTTTGAATTKVAWDAASRTLTRTGPDGRKTTLVSDEKGRTLAISAPGLAQVSMTYDAAGRLKFLTSGAGAQARTTEWAYGAAGQLERIVDPAGREQTFQRDAQGSRISKTLPGQRVLALDADEHGNLTSVTLPSQAAHAFTYDAADLLQTHAPPKTLGDAGAVTRTYDAEGRSTGFTRAGGGSVALERDAKGRPQKAVLDGRTVSFTWDDQSRLKTAITSEGSALAYAYDAGRLGEVTWSGAVSGRVKRTYDAQGRISSRSVNGGAPDAIAWTGGLPSQIGALAISYDPSSKLVSGTALGKVATSQAFNPFGELRSYAATVDGAAVYSATYDRDALGRVTTLTEVVAGASATWSYTYAPAGHLESVKKNGAAVAAYTWDPDTNRLSRTAGATSHTGKYDAQGQLLSWGPYDFTRAANGELASRKDRATGAILAYSIDVMGALRSATLPDGRKVEYLFDGQGRRIGKKVAGQLVEGWLYQDKLRPAAQLDGAGNVVARFVWGTRLNVPDYLEKGGKRYRIVADQVGSPRLVIDAATGTVAQRMDFDEFGRVLADTSPGFQPFGFAGGLLDRDTGLVHFGAREYDPELGRFIARDPRGFHGGFNPFAYAAGDPINFQDPGGEVVVAPALLWALGAAGAALGLNVALNTQRWVDLWDALNEGCSFTPGRSELSDLDRQALESLIARVVADSKFDEAIHGPSYWQQSDPMNDEDSGWLMDAVVDIHDVFADESNLHAGKYMCTGIASAADEAYDSGGGRIPGIANVRTIDRQEVPGREKAAFHQALLVEFEDGREVVLDWWKNLSYDPVVTDRCGF